ncbi:hypothetical protein DFH09DRAFT_1320681 [Mycena vulgaris]|nr:hypothetical protein DFH09DRAFT_1320681 [Mycena vulgaris]
MEWRRSPLSRRVPSTIRGVLRGGACRLRRAASPRTHDAHGHAFGAQRARTHERYARRRARRRASALAAQATVPSAEERERDRGRVPVRVQGGRVEEDGFRGRRDGDVGVAGDARPLPAYPWGVGALLRHPRCAPFGYGRCTGMPFTARARGVRVPARRRRRRRTARRRWTITTAARASIPPPTPTTRDDTPAPDFPSSSPSPSPSSATPPSSTSTSDIRIRHLDI